jgi:two-component system response regulator (stage 0 sporulation protein F)
MAQDSKKLSSSPLKSAKGGITRKKRLLVVDDEVAILIAFKKIFEGFHIEIDTADTYDQAISMINNKDYDAIIADLRLSGILGQEGLEILKYSKQKNPDTRLIMITGYGNPDVRKMAYAIGADFYCEKPVSIDSLQKVLRNMGILHDN